jgi:protocatechuate 3,4-dioxygenase, beta subunit
MSRADPSVHAETDQALYDPVVETPTSYRREGPDAHPPLDYENYKSTRLRHPKQPLIYLPQSITEITGPQLGPVRILGSHDNDLTVQGEEMPIGERIIVYGSVRDTEGKPLRDTLVEIWQANAAGRYAHRWDRWEAPLDPNFHGAGRAVALSSPRSSPAPTPGATTTTPGAPPTSTSA